uniref:USP domain-containing protein n=1 Tax=Cyprinus carpio TaxID=7962 RepID=A0A8C2HMK9_CYPCA
VRQRGSSGRSQLKRLLIRKLPPVLAIQLKRFDYDWERVANSRYRLVGVLVHSGQASGGHYYSYVMQRHGNSSDGQKDRWYKFDDGDVTDASVEST